MTSVVTIFVPSIMDISTLEDHCVLNSNSTVINYHTRLWNGYRVIDVPLGLFNRLIAGAEGKQWEDENPEVFTWLGEADRRRMTCNAFPGEHRPPKPIAAEAVAPHVVRLLAPKGVVSFSHGGVEHKVDNDGSISVMSDLGDILRSHGFRDVA